MGLIYHKFLVLAVCYYNLSFGWGKQVAGDHETTEILNALKIIFNPQVLNMLPDAASIANVQRRLESLGEERSGTKEEFLILTERLSETNDQLRATNDELLFAKGESNETKEEIMQTKKLLKVVTQELRETQAELQDTRNNFLTTREELETVQMELLTLKAQVTLVNEDSNKTKHEVVRTTQALTGLTKVLGETKEDLQETRTELITAREEVDSVQKKLESVQDELGSARSDINLLNTGLSASNKRLVLAATGMTSARQDMTLAKNALRDTSDEIRITKDELQITTLEIDVLKRKLDIALSKIQILDGESQTSTVGSEIVNTKKTRDVQLDMVFKQHVEMMRRFIREEKLVRIKERARFQTQLSLSKARDDKIEHKQRSQSKYLEHIIEAVSNNTEKLNASEAEFVDLKRKVMSKEDYIERLVTAVVNNTMTINLNRAGISVIAGNVEFNKGLLSAIQTSSENHIRQFNKLADVVHLRKEQVQQLSKGHALTILRTKNVTYKGYAFLSVQVRVPADGLSRSESWCRDYQVMCQELGRRPTGCGIGSIWVQNQQYNSKNQLTRCRDEYSSDMNIGDVLDCNPAGNIAKIANIAFPNLSTPASRSNAFGFHMCAPVNCQKTIRGSHNGVSYMGAFRRYNSTTTTMYTVCR